MYELQVEGMTCGGCVNGVKRSVQAVDHNAKVEVDLTSKKVRCSGLICADTSISGSFHL